MGLIEGWKLMLLMDDVNGEIMKNWWWNGAWNCRLGDEVNKDWGWNVWDGRLEEIGMLEIENRLNWMIKWWWYEENLNYDVGNELVCWKN